MWFTEINNELRDTTVGIICLTHENKASPWILFEAGALAKGLATNKVCTFLVDLVPHDIKDPLAQFNHTLPNKESVMNLTATLNSSLEMPLDTNTLTAVFEAFWPKFEKDFAQLLVDFPQEAVIERRSEESILGELLDLTRGLNQRVRVMEEQRTPLANLHTSHDVAVALAKAREAASSAAKDKILIARDAEMVNGRLQDGQDIDDIILEFSSVIGKRRVDQAIKYLGLDGAP